MVTINKVYQGDNLDILKELPDEYADLIYLDPPFNSGKNWGEFDDRFGLMPYLSFMRERLIELRRVLRSFGSLYLHCDTTVSHYLKVELDQIFGIDKFKAEITWQRTTSHNDSGSYGNICDRILYYSAAKTINIDAIRVPLDPNDPSYNRLGKFGYYRAERLTGPGVTDSGESGQPWRDINPKDRGLSWCVPRTGSYAEWIENNVIENYRLVDGIHDRLNLLDNYDMLYWSGNGTPYLKWYKVANKGIVPSNLWTDINNLVGKHSERVNYPTQKPLKLLERIIKASSSAGSTVLDPFCGSGTTLVAAKMLGRDYFGIDINPRAVKISESRLSKIIS